MKKITPFFLLFLLYAGLVQSQTNTTIPEAINTVFSPLEKNRIPHDILIDYGYDFIDVTQYDGILRTNNYMSIGTYKQIYNTLVSSCTSTGVADVLPPMLEFESWANIQKQKNSSTKTLNSANVVLSGLLYNYSKINPNALSNNKIQVVNGKYDDKYINGVWQNPYDVKLTFAISSSVVLINRSDVSVSLPTSLWHANTSVNNIEINFDNGSGYKTLLNGIGASTTYTNPGFYTWTYRIQLSDGQYKYSHQKIEITALTDSSQNNSQTCTNIPITANKSYLGVKGQATLQIQYADGNCELRNPLIVAEGLDTGLLGQGGSLGDNDIGDFQASIFRSSSTNLDNLLNGNIAEYDIIYVNWDNGTDYIQRNAYALESVIEWVNQQKALNGSSEPNVVLGQSMGGLIARYALKEMEDDPSLDHDTSLYISHDAPHQGAHVPMGLLYMARHIENQFIRTPLGGIEIPLASGSDIGLATISNLLDAPAVKQMLINNVDANLNRDNTLHDSWQTELKNKGYPQQTRNIALSNASHCAADYNLASNETLLDITGRGSIGGFDNLIVLLFPYGSVAGYILEDFSTFALGFLPGGSELDAEFRVKAFPTTGVAQLYKGRITYEKKLLWLIPITRTITNIQKDSPSGTLFYDNYPGGAVPGVEGYTINSNENFNLLFANGIYNVNVNPNFSFISSVSALDVGEGNTTLSHPDFYKVYTAAYPPTGIKAIPFVNFTTSFNQNNNINEPHISFNTLSGDWLAEELDTNSTSEVFDCSFTCMQILIEGGSSICSAGAEYSIQTGANVQWSASPANLVNITNNGSSNVTITPVSSSSNGSVTLTAIINSPDCGSRTLTKRIQVGAPRIYTLNIDGTKNYMGTSYSYPISYSTREITVHTDGLSTYSWDMFPGNIQWTAVNNKATFYINVAGNYLLTATAANDCGESMMFFSIDIGGINNYDIYPNPASSEINIEKTSVAQQSASIQTAVYTNAKIPVQLLDFNGVLVRTIEISAYETITQLDVSDLKEGLYFLIIGMGEEKETYKIIVAR